MYYKGKSRSKSKLRKAVQCYKCKDYEHMRKDYLRLRGQNDEKRMKTRQNLQMWFRMMIQTLEMEICWFF